jgi:Lrp/AsnC family leucine-responsive transcriptional regulator
MIDSIDLKILGALQENSSLSNVELADKVGLSPSASLRRVRELRERGYIEGFRAALNRAALGLGVHAFVEVRLERQTEAATEKFLDRVRRIPEIVSCYLMTGTLDYLLEVVTTDLEAYGHFATTVLTALPGVKEMTSSFVLKEVAKNRALPLRHLGVGFRAGILSRERPDK